MTDTQLQLAIAKMLPEKIRVSDLDGSLVWISFLNGDEQTEKLTKVKPTEWEHIVRLVEETFDAEQMNDYINYLMSQTHSIFDREHLVHASWQKRATAILKVKGVI